MDILQREYDNYKRKLRYYDKQAQSINPECGNTTPVSFEEFVKTYFGVELVNAREAINKEM